MPTSYAHIAGMEKNKDYIIDFLHLLIIALLIYLVSKLMASYALVHLQTTFFYITLTFSLLTILLLGQVGHAIYLFFKRKQTMPGYLHMIVLLICLFMLLMVAVNYEKFQAIIRGEISNQARRHIMLYMPYIYLTAFLILLAFSISIRQLLTKLCLTLVKIDYLIVIVVVIMIGGCFHLEKHIGIHLSENLMVHFSGQNGAGQIASITHPALSKAYPAFAKTLTYSYDEHLLSNGDLVTIQIHYDHQLAKREHLFVHHTVKHVRVHQLITTYSYRDLPQNIIDQFVSHADLSLLKQYPSQPGYNYSFIRDSLWYDDRQHRLIAVYQMNYKNANMHAGPYYCAIICNNIDSTYLHTKHAYYHELLIREDGQVVDNHSDMNKVFDDVAKMIA